MRAVRVGTFMRCYVGELAEESYRRVVRLLGAQIQRTKELTAPRTLIPLNCPRPTPMAPDGHLFCQITRQSNAQTSPFCPRDDYNASTIRTRVTRDAAGLSTARPRCYSLTAYYNIFYPCYVFQHELLSRCSFTSL